MRGWSSSAASGRSTSMHSSGIWTAWRRPHLRKEKRDMSVKQYAPGAAFGAEVRKDGDKWTLVLVRDLRHPPATVWQALTDPEHLREWAPFDADQNLGATGVTAKLTTIGAPKPHVTETKIKRADPPKALEYNWGGGDVRWELEP